MAGTARSPGGRRAANAARARQRSRGVTLLEILVVIIIAAVAAAVAGPPIAAMISAIQFDGTADTLSRRIVSLRTEAMLRRETLVFPPIDDAGRVLYQDFPFPWESGWEVEGDVITFLPTAVCSGGVLTLRAPSGRVRRLDLAGPHCALPE